MSGSFRGCLVVESVLFEQGNSTENPVDFERLAVTLPETDSF